MHVPGNGAALQQLSLMDAADKLRQHATAEVCLALVGGAPDGRIVIPDYRCCL